MLLKLLTKEEKQYFLDLMNFIVSMNSNNAQVEIEVIKQFKSEMGDEINNYHKSSKKEDDVLKYFQGRPKVTRNIVYLNILFCTLSDVMYSTEEHFFIEKVQEVFGISNRKKNELIKIVFAERDIVEHARQSVME